MTRHETTQSAELQSIGMKATVPRMKVLELFQSSSRRHLTADDVYKVLLNDNADIALATVYRVLMQFAEAGVLLRSHFESGRALFELNEGTHHDHLVCVECGQIEEFADPQIERRQKSICAERGFELKEHSLALYGVCSRPECQAAARPSRTRR